MGLSVSVGSLAWCLKNGYTEDAELHRRDVQEVNRVLAANGLPPHVEPETIPELKDRSGFVGLPYSWLHYLRRAVAFARQAPGEYCPVPEGEDPAQDERVDRELFVVMHSHLICHSDGGGFYVPIAFSEPLYDDHDESVICGILGSCQQVLRELIEAAPLLGIRLTGEVLSDEAAEEIAAEPDGSNPYWRERKVWLKLFDRFRHSVECKAMVTFG